MSRMLGILAVIVTITFGLTNAQSTGLLDGCRQEYSTISPFQHTAYFNIGEISDILANGTVEFKVLVQSAENARLVLATRNPNNTITVAYQIRLADNSNRRFTIHRLNNELVRVNRDNLLANTAWFPLIVRIFTDGGIEAQIEGERTAFLRSTNRNPLPVHYVSFNSNLNPPSVWQFNCPIQRRSPRVCRELVTHINDTEYRTFWNATDLEHNQSFGEFRLSLRVRAAQNVRILLSTVPHATPRTSAPFYEVILGANGNREYELHRSTHRMDRTTSNNLLSPTAFVDVQITIAIDGTVTILVAGSRLRLRNRDVHPIDVRFFSFRSADPTATTNWLFDC